MSPGPCLCDAEKHASWGRETAQPLLHTLALRTFPLLDVQVKGFPHDRGFCRVKSGANEAGEGAERDGVSETGLHQDTPDPRSR